MRQREEKEEMERIHKKHGQFFRPGLLAVDVILFTFVTLKNQLFKL
jgi:hypothetical protein